MRKFQKLITDVGDHVLKSNKTNCIIIGENTSGKSDAILKIIEECLKRDNSDIYFIDSVNRSFHLELVGDSSERKQYDYNAIRKMRVGKGVFNKRDTFETGNIESIYWMYESKLKEMVLNFFGLVIDIKNATETETPIAIPPKLEIIKSGKSFSEEGKFDLNIPNGMQAGLRIFLELLFFESSIKENSEKRNHMVFIEELDSFLSENYSSRILNFVNEQFPDFKFIVTTHSKDLVLHAENATVVGIKDGDFEIVETGEDYILDVEELFAAIFHKEQIDFFTNDDKIDRQLRILLNRKINGSWDLSDNEELLKLKKVDLLPHHKFIIDEIEVW